jgi:hypothetical protein
MVMAMVIATAGQGFVDGVVDHFPDQVVHAAHVRAADVHRRAFAHGFEAFEHLDRIFGVASRGV